MTGDFTSNVRLFEDVHGLQQQWFDDPKIRNEPLDGRRSRKPVKDRIEVVERVSDLINRSLLALPQRSVRKKSILFKEKTNLVP